MIDAIREEKCDSCAVCVENCPVSIFKVIAGRVRISQPEMCADCGICLEVCPNQAIHTKAEAGSDGK